jgi:tRNA-2-methylthio-N6-dimethylallyladenosine synthase
VARKYLIETFGCQMNVHDSERMAGLLEQAGYEATDEAADADVVVINTCSVRERAEDKLYTRLGELRQLAAEQGHNPIVAVAGCVAQQEGDAILKRSPGVADVIVGTQAIRRLPMMVEQAAAQRRPVINLDPFDDVTFPLGVTKRNDPLKAYVTIIEGCNEFCSFCVVPYTRGNERMRPKSDILAEVREAAATGHREVQLLGQIVNHYAAPDDPSCDFSGLLEAVHAVDGIERIRFASPHPRHVSPRFLEAMARLPKICRHLHLPVQSGSTRVLDSMFRDYTREEYLERIAWMKAARNREISITTDTITGFPGETEEDFHETLSLLSEVGFDGVFAFKYSPRPNTPSLQYPDSIPDAEKSRRLQILQEHQREIQRVTYRRHVGQVMEVMVEGKNTARGQMIGRTSQNKTLNFVLIDRPEPMVGSYVPVLVTQAFPNSLLGQLVGDDTPD